MTVAGLLVTQRRLTVALTLMAGTAISRITVEAMFALFAAFATSSVRTSLTLLNAAANSRCRHGGADQLATTD